MTPAGERDLARRIRGRVRNIERGIRAAGGLRPWIGYFPGPGPRLMSALRRRWVVWRNPQAHIEFRGPVYLGPRFSLDIPHGGTFIVGPGVEFRRGFRAEIARGGRLVIGAGCHLTYDVVIACSTSIEIGERVSLAQATYVVDGNHRFRDWTRPFIEQGYDFRPVRIEDDVLVLTKCTIMNSIGTHSVVAAHAVVNRPIPPYCVAGGVPARLIEYFGPPGEEPPELRAPAAER